MNIATLFEKRAVEHPDQPAIIQPPSRGPDVCTFAQLRETSAALAAKLAALSIRTGDHVNLFTPLSTSFYIALLATLRIGAVPVVIDPAMGIGHMRRCLRRVRPKAVIGTRSTLMLARLFPELWSAKKVRVTASPCTSTPAVRTVSPNAPALLTFTSGSTGQPKAVVRSHALLLAQDAALSTVLQQTPSDISLVTLPIFTLTNLAAGVTSLLADANPRRPGFIDPAPVLSQIKKHRPTSTVASPAFLLRLVDGLTATKTQHHLFDRIFTGGAPVFPDMIERIASLARTGSVIVVYGSTEAEPIAHRAHHHPPNHTPRPNTPDLGLPVGKPGHDVKLRIIPDTWGTPLGPFDAHTFEAMTLPPNTPGEIVVAGDHVVPGYLDGIGDIETKIHVANHVWHRTGDAGRIDSSGQLWLLGRCAAQCTTPDGDPIYPFPCEAAIRAELGIRSALVSIDESPALILEMQSAKPDADMLRAAITIAARFRIPTVSAIHTLPLDSRHNAKINYAKLRTQTFSPISQTASQNEEPQTRINE